MTKKIIRLKSVIHQGHQIASGTAEENPYPAGSLALQASHFKKGGLDLNKYFNGTLNLSIAPARFSIIQPDFHFKNVEWADGFPPEDFKFVGCHLEYDNQTFEGMIYYPDPATKIGHFQDPSVIEVLTQKIDGLFYGETMHIILDLTKVHIE